MPDLGGYDVVRLLQGTPQTKNIPVIVMTAKNFDDSTIKMIKAESNVFGFLYKPFKPSELIKMLDVVVRGGRVPPFDNLSSAGTAPSSAAPAIGGPNPLSSGVDEVKRGGAPAPEPTLGVRAASASSQEGGTPSEGKAPAKPRKEKPREEEDSAPSMVKGLFQTLLKGALGGILFFGLLFGVAEWTCRRAEETLGVSFFAPPLYPASRFSSFMPYQWHDPKITAPSYWENGRVVYQINQWGLRGPGFPLVTPTGARRILLLGGTSTFGVGVRERETLAIRLEALLNENRPGAFQVINAGLWALSPEEQWAFVKGQGFNFKPETILWLCENRGPGVPTTDGLRWLAAHRWLVSIPFSESRFIQLLVQLKIRGSGDPSPKGNDPLFREAEKNAKEQKSALSFWILPQGPALAAFQETVLDRLARAVETKGE
ncbi:MAG: response regulator [Elusimicrobia bacterium]|nr:response regulator [Elusimicrobiota bacterium]